MITAENKWNTNSLIDMTATFDNWPNVVNELDGLDFEELEFEEIEFDLQELEFEELEFELEDIPQFEL